MVPPPTFFAPVLVLQGEEGDGAAAAPLPGGSASVAHAAGVPGERAPPAARQQYVATQESADSNKLSSALPPSEADERKDKDDARFENRRRSALGASASGAGAIVYTERFDFRKAAKIMTIPSNVLVFAQSIPGCIPWGAHARLVIGPLSAPVFARSVGPASCLCTGGGCDAMYA